MLCKLACLLAALCLVGSPEPAQTAQVDADSVYCFTAGDFSCRAEPLRGVCITGLPDPATGTVLLGTRIIQPGDILTAEQLSQMTFCPVYSPVDRAAQVEYLPVYSDFVDSAATLTISVHGREDKAPTAQDLQLQTYQNMANDGRLQATDPEGKGLTYSVLRQPRRGQVVLGEDGSFTYTPKSNKVGADSFTYAVTDPAGNVSREATVTVTILKPSQSPQYTDTQGLSCQFEAEWLKNTGLFAGQTLGGRPCFEPEKPVTAGELLAMLTGLAGLSEQDGDYASLTAAAPRWLQPYLAAALRMGLLHPEELERLDADRPVTLAETALLTGRLKGTQTVFSPALPDSLLTRADCAQLLYDLSH